MRICLHARARRPVARGQISVEFFLVVGFIISLVAILVANSEAQIARNTLLDNTLLSQSALDSVSNAIQTVYLQGNRSAIRQMVFVPRDANCFILDQAKKKLTCDVGDPEARLVYSRPLTAVPDTITADCTEPGWLFVAVEYNQPFLNISCVKT